MERIRQECQQEKIFKKIDSEHHNTEGALKYVQHTTREVGHYLFVSPHY